MQERHGGIKEHSVDKVWSKYGMNGVQVFLVLEDKYSKVTCFHSMNDLIGLFMEFGIHYQTERSYKRNLNLGVK